MHLLCEEAHLIFLVIHTNTLVLIVYFQIRTEWGVLPKDNEARTDILLHHVVQSVTDQGAKASNREIVLEMAENETSTLSQDVPDLGYPIKHLALCTILAHCHDRVFTPEISGDAKESAEEFLKGLLEESLTGSVQDSLTPLAGVISRSLGSTHPVSAWMSALADKNMSKAAKRAELEKQQLLEAELRAKVMQEEWPDRGEMAAAR